MLLVLTTSHMKVYLNRFLGRRHPSSSNSKEPQNVPLNVNRRSCVDVRSPAGSIVLCPQNTCSTMASRGCMPTHNVLICRSISVARVQRKGLRDVAQSRRLNIHRDDHHHQFTGGHEILIVDNGVT